MPLTSNVISPVSGFVKRFRLEYLFTRAHASRKKVTKAEVVEKRAAQVHVWKDFRTKLVVCERTANNIQALGARRLIPSLFVASRSDGPNMSMSAREVEAFKILGTWSVEVTSFTEIVIAKD